MKENRNCWMLEPVFWRKQRKKSEQWHPALAWWLLTLCQCRWVLFTRVLVKDKNRALSENKGNWERKMLVSEEPKNELWWWVENTEEQSAPIYRPNPTNYDENSSLTGWGALIAGTEKQRNSGLKRKNGNTSITLTTGCFSGIKSAFESGDWFTH